MQNEIDIITKCDSFYIAKCDKSLLQNASGFLLQNATINYNLQQLLESTLISLQNATVIINCDVYYKMRRYVKPIFLFIMVLQMVFISWEKGHLAHKQRLVIQML